MESWSSARTLRLHQGRPSAPPRLLQGGGLKLGASFPSILQLPEVAGVCSLGPVPPPPSLQPRPALSALTLLTPKRHLPASRGLTPSCSQTRGVGGGGPGACLSGSMDFCSGFTGKAVAEGGRGHHGNFWLWEQVGWWEPILPGARWARLALGTRKAPRLPPRSPHRLGEAQRPSPTWNYRLPCLPPANGSPGRGPGLLASPPSAAPPIPELLIDEPITKRLPGAWGSPS